MPWAKDSDRTDASLGRYRWKLIRKHWRRLQLPCARCGQPIDYTAKWPHPRSLVVGHIVSRREARSLGWPESAINSLSNTQPEHVDCSNKSGAALGRRLQGQKAARILQGQKPTWIIADRW